MVKQVANGHNCWLASNQACADIMTTWISNWASGSSGSAPGTQMTAHPAARYHCRRDQGVPGRPDAVQSDGLSGGRAVVLALPLGYGRDPAVTVLR